MIDSYWLDVQDQINSEVSKEVVQGTIDQNEPFDDALDAIGWGLGGALK